MGGALLASAFAHAMAAVTAGAILRSGAGARAPVIHQEVAAVDVAVDVDVAPAAAAPDDGSAAASAATHLESLRARGHHRAATNGPPAGDVAAPADPHDGPARFALGAGAVATRAPSAGAQDDEALGEGEVSVPARLLAASPLPYPPSARQAQIEIDLPLELVVDATGRVCAARGLTRAGYGLDEAALQAARAYRFSPARRDGRAVRVRMRWTMQFRLR